MYLVTIAFWLSLLNPDLVYKMDQDCQRITNVNDSAWIVWKCGAKPDIDEPFKVAYYEGVGE